MKNSREKIVVKTSIISICANLVLVAFKATVGLLSNSIAIITDAVNNLSDALSSIVTIIGTKLAGKAPDKKIFLSSTIIIFGISSFFVEKISELTTDALSILLPSSFPPSYFTQVSRLLLNPSKRLLRQKK